MDDTTTGAQEEVRDLIESAFTYKSPMHYDRVLSWDVQAFLDNEALMRDLDAEYTKVMSAQHRLVVAEFRVEQISDPELDGKEFVHDRMWHAKLAACMEVYAKNPSLAVAWMVHKGFFYELHKTILRAGMTGNYVRTTDVE